MWQKKRYSYGAAFYQFIWIIVMLWTVEIVDQNYFGERLDFLGLQPGNWNHWEGIFFAPVLHADWPHLLGNSIGLVILGSIILLRGWRDLALASFFSIIIGGLGTMILGNTNSYHIGASGVVYGYFGFLLSAGFVEKTAKAITIAVLVAITHWGMTAAMLPNEFTQTQNISWEGHLCGALGGFLAAKEAVKRGGMSKR